MTNAIAQARLRNEFARISREQFSAGTTEEGIAALDRLIDEYGAPAVQNLIDELETPSVGMTNRWSARPD
ncbi:hypothetical protein ACWGJT_20390 [Streptomyces xantholiticus]